MVNPKVPTVDSVIVAYTLDDRGTPLLLVGKKALTLIGYPEILNAITGSDATDIWNRLTKAERKGE